MRRRLLIMLALVPLVVLGLAVLTKGWLMNSDAGSAWLVNRVSNSLEGDLFTATMDGNLANGMVVSGIQFEQDGLVIEIRQLDAIVVVSLLPPQISVNYLHVQDLKILQADSEKTSQAPPLLPEDILAGLTVPIGVNLENVQISGVVLALEGEADSIHLDSVSMNGRWKDDIEVHQLDIKAPVFDTALQGVVGLKPPFKHQWKARLKFPDVKLSQAPGAIAEFDLELEGDENSTNLTVTSDSNEIEITGFVTDPFKKALLSLEFSAGQLVWAADETVFEVQISGLSGMLKGSADNYHLTFQADLETDSLSAIHFSMTGKGNLERLNIGSLVAEAGYLDVSGTGVVEWIESGSFELDLEVRRFEPGLWISDWPRENFLHGKVSLRSEEVGIRVREFSASVAGTQIDIKGEAVLDSQEDVLNADLSWQKLGWPLGQEAQEYSSDTGQLLLSGSPEDWRFEGALEFETREYPGGSFVLTGSGGTESAMISISKGELLGGTLTGQASLDWQGAFRWNAELDVKQVDTGALLADWPARLDAKLGLSQDTGKDLFKLNIDNLEGELKGQDVRGSGRLIFEESEVRFRSVNLQSGGSKVSVDGQFAGSSGLAFEVDVQKPGWMSDLIGGEVIGKGRIALEAPQPVMDINLRGRNFEWGEIRAGSILLRNGPDTNGTGGLNLSLEAEDLEFGNFALQTMQAGLVGDRNEQALNVKAVRSDVSIEATLIGAITNWDSLADSNWRGQLANLTLASGQDALVKLKDSAPIFISAKAFSLDQACLLVTDSGGLCVESSWASDGHVDIVASLSDLSPGVSQLFHEHDIEFTQSLDGAIRWEKIPGQLPSGHAAINISAGRFGDDQDEFDPVTTEKGFFGFELDNGNLTAGQLDIPFPGIGQIDLDYAISGLALDGTGKVNGKIKIDLNDISVLEQMLPGLGNVSGSLSTDLRVTGVMIDPQIDGYIALRNSSADVSYLGTQLRQVNLDGIVSSKDSASLQGEFTAGEGRGEVSMKAEFSDWLAPAMEMTFSGSSLRVLNTSELRMDADSDFRLSWGKGEWLIDGGVVVKQARIAPVTFVVNKVTESEDVQVVAGSILVGEQGNVVKPVRISGNFNVSLGDELIIDTALAKAKLSGDVKLTWDGALIPIANGGIQADGTLSVFGPALHLRDSRLRFPGIPVNDPELDLRAERDIFGNTQIRTAGVRITGSAKRPVIEAYTNPYSTSDRAWAVLITGSDVEYGQGVGAFEVGTYIAPKLYLGYGISLFDDNNVVSARYDLKKGFGVKASSGQRESGIDMSYTIDR